MKYKVQTCSYGHGLFATSPIEPGEIVDCLQGYETAYEKLSEKERRLAIYLGLGRCFVITNGLIYANHACDANCRMWETTSWPSAALSQASSSPSITTFSPFPAATIPPRTGGGTRSGRLIANAAGAQCQGLVDGYRFSQLID